MLKSYGLSVIPVQCSRSAVQLEGLEQQLAEVTAKAALFEGRFQEERVLRRQVSPILSCNNAEIMGFLDRSSLA